MAGARQEPQESRDLGLRGCSGGLAVIQIWEEASMQGQGKWSRPQDLPWKLGLDQKKPESEGTAVAGSADLVENKKHLLQVVVGSLSGQNPDC